MEYRQFLAILLYFSFSSSDETLTTPLIVSLNGDSWMVKGIKNSTSITGTVPGGIYTDLINAGILKDDIFFENNDVKYRWVAKEDWIYSTTFEVGQDVLSRENIWLVFHGLDTVGTIFLNNQTLGDANNMFVRYRYDVKPILKQGKNDLQVKFQSPITAADNLSAASKYKIPPSCTPSEYQGECHVNFLRKMQASFAWDWGPAFPSVGIWKPVNLEAYDKIIIRTISIATEKIMDTWEVLATIYLDTAPKKTFTVQANVKIYVTLANKRIQEVKFDYEPADIHIISNEEGEASFTINELYIQENYVRTWWPNGYGTQTLYSLEITVKTDDKEVTSKTTQFGFRTVKLVQDEIDCHKPSKGRAFYFEINGIKIFSKGTNFIPAHILPEKGTDIDRVRLLLLSVKVAHMNMIRVWGGGVYETDEFYNLCDQMGIMVWQDMMFACNMYPANDEFLSSVSKEITQNVRRLQSHPSIVLWAGNNENEVALVQSWYGTSSNYQQYKNDYVRLYVDTIKKIVEANDKSRSYITSSPTNGLKTDEEGSVSLSPYDRLFGDIHEYTYYADNWKATSTEPARFISEYGIQSMPSFSTLLEATTLENMSLTSAFFKKRQHHASGYQQMTSEISMNMNNPENKDIQTYIYYSQINQAMSIKAKTETYRRNRDLIEENGNGNTMGALYWQLNDVWQAPSWSSIEYGGKWKMLHNFAKEFFAQVLVSPWITDVENLAVSIVSDKRTGPPLKLTLYTHVYFWNSESPVSTNVTEAIKVNPLSSVVLPEVPLNEVLKEADCGPLAKASKTCFLVFNLKDKKNNDVAPQAFLIPESINRIAGPTKSTIQVLQVKQHDVQTKNIFLPKDAQKYDITLITDVTALFVWLDVGKIEGHFEENGFLFIPKKKTVSFISYKKINECQIIEALTIQTINGSFSINEKARNSCMMNDETKEPVHEEAQSVNAEKPDEEKQQKESKGKPEESKQDTKTVETPSTKTSEPLKGNACVLHYSKILFIVMSLISMFLLKP
ncbi:beta-mannosidase-like [Lycorma delicatula]|uniref:beta-mannosidase-like n=1 Tax=Lycorma delicatula TaxID=130591 RepID=UPI003F50FEC4